MDKDTIYFSSKLKERRLELSMTQKELGYLVGVSDNTITNYEKGNRETNREMLLKLADALNVSENYFFSNTFDTSNLKQRMCLLLYRLLY